MTICQSFSPIIFPNDFSWSSCVMMPSIMDIFLKQYLLISGCSNKLHGLPLDQTAITERFILSGHRPPYLSSFKNLNFPQCNGDDTDDVYRGVDQFKIFIPCLIRWISIVLKAGSWSESSISILNPVVQPEERIKESNPNSFNGMDVSRLYPPDLFFILNSTPFI